MQLQTISVKELRTNMPKVLKAIQKGASYTLIHRSKPVAEIKPVSSSHEGLKRLLELGPSFHFRSKKSAVELIREERDEKFQKEAKKFVDTQTPKSFLS